MHASDGQRAQARTARPLLRLLLAVTVVVACAAALPAVHAALATLQSQSATVQQVQLPPSLHPSPLRSFSARISSVTHGRAALALHGAQSQRSSVDPSSSGDAPAPSIVGAASQWARQKQSALRDSFHAFRRVTHSVVAVTQPTRKTPAAKDAATPVGGAVPVHHRNLAGGPGSLELGSFELSDEQKASVRARFGTSSKALGMRNKSPRWGPSYPVYVHESGEQSDPHGIGISWYLWNVALCAIIGIGIAIAQLLLTGIYFFFRILVWRCCCHKKSEHEEFGFPGYLTFWKKYWPVLFVSVFVALACAFAVVGIVYNNGVSKTFSSTDSENGVGPLALQIMYSLDDWMGDIIGVVRQLTSDVYDVKPALDGLISGFTGLGAATRGVSAAANTFGAKYSAGHPSFLHLSGFSVVANGTTWYCDVRCQVMGVAASTLGGEIDAQVTPRFDEFQATVDDVGAEFVSIADDITDKLEDAQREIDSARGSVISDDNKELIEDNSKLVNDYDVYRNAVFLALFSLVFLSPIMVGLGLAAKRGCPFKCVFCCGIFYVSIIWLLFGVHWMLGLLIGDACVYLDDSMVDLSSSLESQSGGETLSSVLNACMVNASLITALNLTEQLQFADLIKFPDALDSDEINAAFDLKGLDSMLAEVGLVSAASFLAEDGYTAFDEAAVVDANLNAMSALPIQGSCSTVTYTRPDVLYHHATAHDPAQHYHTCYIAPELEQILALQQTVFEGIEIAAALQGAVTEVVDDVTQISLSVSALRNQLVTVVDLIASTSNPNSIRSSLEPVFGVVNNFRDASYCYEQAEAFGNFKDTLCNQLEDSIQWMTFALFIIGLSCWPITWCSRWSSYRIEFVPRIAPAPFDEHGWMVANTAPQQPQYGNYAGQDVQMAQMGQEGAQTHQFQQQGPQETNGAYDQQQYDQQQQQQQQYDQQEQQQQGNAQQEPLASPSFDEQQRVAAEQQWQQQEQQQEQPLASPSAAAPAEEDGAASSPAAAAEEAAEGPAAGAPKCDSCEGGAATVRCQECDESFCESCDETLHKSAENADHNRTHI